MIRNIIIEGPDGSGKTTLITHLRDALNMPVHAKASSSTEGPVDDLWGWVERDIPALMAGGQIYDRHPVISEPIYGRIVRKSVREYFDDAVFIQRITALMNDHCVVVWCIPSLEVVSQNVFANARDQMPGVTLNIGKVHQAYMTAYFRWRGLKRQYDYTRHDKPWFTDELKRMINE